MEEQATLDSERSKPADADAAELYTRLKRAEEQVRLLEREKLITLKEAADIRRGAEEALVGVREELEAAKARIVELEGERDEIRALLEKFLAENWSDLKEDTPAGGVPTDLARLLADAERQELAAGSAGGTPPTDAGVSTGPDASPAAAPSSEPPASKEALKEMLEAGASVDTTEAFGRFEPVTTSHIKVSDWLARAHDYTALKNLARNELSEEELLSVLYLLSQKAYIRVDPS